MTTRPIFLFPLRSCLIVLALTSMSACILAAGDVIPFADSIADPTASNDMTEHESDAGPSAERLSQALKEKPVNDISVNDAVPAKGVERVPGDAFKEAYGKEDSAKCYVPAERGFAHQQYFWKASGLLHKPLYFEDVSLERYGQTHILQPAVSGLKFFATVPLLPYRIGVDHPCKCIYTLGYQRPGNCACPVREHLPLSLKGAALEAGALTGFVFLFP